MPIKADMKASLKDAVVLFLSNIVAEALSMWLIAPLIAQIAINESLQGFSIDTVLNWYINKTMYLGYAAVIGYIFINLFRYLTTSHYIRKYKATDKLDILGIRRILPIIIIVIFMEIIIYPLLANEPYKLQALAEYNYFVELGVGIYGYLLELPYYILEGLRLATILYMGSRANQWCGLLLLLILWTPIHILHGSGIDAINFIWAVSRQYYSKLQGGRRTTTY